MALQLTLKDLLNGAFVELEGALELNSGAERFLVPDGTIDIADTIDHPYLEPLRVSLLSKPLCHESLTSLRILPIAP